MKSHLSLKKMQLLFPMSRIKQM